MSNPFVMPAPPWPSVANNADSVYGQCLRCAMTPVSLVQPDGTLYVANIFDLIGGMSSGRLNLAEALSRRLVTKRGTLIGAPNYGYDVTDLLNDDLGTAELNELGSNVEAEMKKDDRVRKAAATVTVVGNLLMISVSITDAVGPFTLTLMVSAVGVSVILGTA